MSAQRTETLKLLIVRVIRAPWPLLGLDDCVVLTSDDGVRAYWTEGYNFVKTLLNVAQADSLKHACGTQYRDREPVLAHVQLGYEWRRV